MAVPVGVIQRLADPFELTVGEPLEPFEEKPADPEQRVALAAPMPGHLLLGCVAGPR